MSEVTEYKPNQQRAELFRQYREMKSKVEEHYQKALKWKANRDELNKHTSQLASKLREEREQRNRANEKVGELKVLKDELSKELEERKSIVEELKKKERELTISLKDNPAHVRDRIRRLEWYLQTNVLSLGRENELVKEISKLEKRLVQTKEIDELNGRLLEVTGKANSIRNKVNEYRTQMLEHVRISQGHHATVVEVIKQIEELRKQADSAHEKYLESFNLASRALLDSKKILERVRELDEKETTERTRNHVDRKKDFEERVEKVSTQAIEKVKKGGKITMDELSILVEKGFFDESQKP